MLSFQGAAVTFQNILIENSQDKFSASKKLLQRVKAGKAAQEIKIRVLP
jgi:hypothetical protein